jgi:hypothetical protein
MDGRETPPAGTADERRVGERRRGGDEDQELKVLRHQVQAVIANVRELALLGGYGSGKSTGGVMRFKRHCALNGRNRRRKGKAIKTPKAAIVAPTYKNLMQGSMATFEAVFPPEWIHETRGNPNPHVELTNGVVIELHSGPTLESTNYFAILVEEVQHKAYGDREWANFTARVRDPDAVTLTETYTGLPEEGRVRLRFDKPPAPRTDKTGGNWTILVPTSANTALKPEVIAAILASVPSTEAEKLIKGQWMLPTHAVFPGYDSTLHVRPEVAMKPDEPIHVGLDPGPLAFVAFGQLRALQAILPSAFKLTRPEYGYEDIGLDVVGQCVVDGQGMEGVCEAILRTPYARQIVAGKSTITVDPTISQDDRRTIRRYFPGVDIREADQYNGAADERMKNINRCLRDTLGTVRLRFSPALSGAKRGVLDALAGCRRHEISGELVDDNWLEHARDALGYLVERLLPPPYSKAPQAALQPVVYKRR